MSGLIPHVMRNHAIILFKLLQRHTFQYAMKQVKIQQLRQLITRKMICCAELPYRGGRLQFYAHLWENARDTLHPNEEIL